MPMQLVDLEIHKIAGVEKPANQRSFLVVKSATQTPSKTAEAPKEATMSKTAEPSRPNLEGTPDDVQAYITTLEKRVQEAPAKESTPAPTTLEEMLAKADLPDVVKSQLLKSHERAEAAEQIAKAERDARLNAEAIRKAERDLPNMGDALKLGPVLKRAQEKLGDDDYAVLEETLKAANEQLAQGTVLKELGGGGDEPSDAEQELEKLAKSVRESNPDLTPEQAYNAALEQRPDLYEASL